MAVITIREKAERQEGGWDASVAFDHGPEYPIVVTNPFIKEEEDELEWYFEEHLRLPFLHQARAEAVANSIPAYGEKLFKQVFGDPDIYAEYRAFTNPGLSHVTIEILGSSKFHTIHWEALRDHKTHHCLALQAILLHQNQKPPMQTITLRPYQTINLLIVTARPYTRRDVGYRTISRPLVEALRRSNLPVNVDILRPGTYSALEKHLRAVMEQHQEGYYHVIHFDVHGSVLTYEEVQQILAEDEGAQKEQPDNSQVFKQPGTRQQIAPFEGSKAFLAFEDEEKDGLPDLVEASTLANLLIAHRVPIAILNACQSGKETGDRETSLGSYLVQAGVQFVLAMGYSVTAEAASLFMSELYEKLFANLDLPVAIRHARMELYNRKERRVYFDQQIQLEDWLLPVAYQNRPVKLHPRAFTPEERAAWYENKAEKDRYKPLDPTYGFVGRDLDILHIEKQLTRRNLLLIRGMGGAGKTTLLRHLAWWWHTTGFVRKVFYFGYDEKAWTLQQILTTIAQDLYGERYYTDFQPLSLKAQQAMLTEDLRAANHLLILDNLESITGAELVIQYTLPQNEREALRGFLIHLTKGRTLVLLGSRGSEDWLAKGTFEDNLYDLGGLDDEAATTLADRIFEKYEVTHYRRDDNLRKLLKVLDGFPLAMEVVLPNLKQQTPAQILDALQAGDVKLDAEEGKQQGKDIFEQKTRSLVKCIEYSYNNLSPEAQQLLLCLAPFTSVFWSTMLERYSKQLKQQPVLANLPFERWQDVIHEAQNWGLLSQHEVSDFLHVQPIFPYFLRNRLNKPEQVEAQGAIAKAFRQHYNQVGDLLFLSLDSKDPQERMLGQIVVGMEYENLMTALNYALKEHVSILSPYRALSAYLDVVEEQQRGLELGQIVLRQLEAYPAEKLTEQLRRELVGVIDNIARRQLAMKQFAAAATSYQRALELHQGLNMPEEESSKKLSAGIYGNLGAVALEQRKWQEALRYLQQALAIYNEYNELEEQAVIYHRLGIIALELRKWAEAKQCYSMALAIYEMYNERHKQGLVYHQLGRVAEEQRMWEEAEENYLQALAIYEEYNDHYEQARTYHQLGVVAEQQQRWAQAEYYYQQSLAIKVEYTDRFRQASTYHHLGVVAEFQEKWAEAENYYRQALAIKIEYDDRYKQASTYHQLGSLAEKQGKWEEAENYYNEALAIKIEYNDSHGQASTYFQLGRLAEDQRNWTQARDYFIKSLAIIWNFDDVYHTVMVIAGLARIWKASGDASLPRAVTKVIGGSVEETKGLLRKALGEGKNRR